MARHAPMRDAFRDVQRSRDAPLDARRAALAARARSALIEAEALSALASVAGPADAVPARGDLAAWGADYYRRAREALRRAADWQADRRAEVRARATRIARRIAEGARIARRILAPDAGDVRDGLAAVERGARTLAISAGLGVGTVVALGLLGTVLLAKTLG